MLMLCLVVYHECIPIQVDSEVRWFLLCQC
jgi:hypothetical protein